MADCTDVSTCCPQCSDETQAAVACWLDCLPACVSETLLEYSTCYTLRRCSTNCKAALLDKYDAIQAQAEAVTANATGVSSYSIDVTNVNDVSTAQVTIDYAIDEIPDGATCQTYEEYAVNDVCELGLCCSKCLSQLEAVMECIVNEVVSVAASGTSADCDFTCSTSRRTTRLLQPSTSRPDLPQSILKNMSLPDGDAGVLATGMLSCVQGLAQNLTLDPSLALRPFVSCIESSQGTFSLQVEQQEATNGGASSSSTSQPQSLMWMMMMMGPPMVFQLLAL